MALTSGFNEYILHADLNSFYANVECLYRPEIRDKPVIVTGDPEARHGIVLTKNNMAKKYGIKTGEAIWEAKQKCKEVVAVPANYPLYMRYSNEFRAILNDYSDCLETFGLDESWISISGRDMTIEKAARIADEIRHRTKYELGLTSSVGVSYNKPFAKLGSDMRKPNATSIITKDNFREKVWPLPASDLLYCGPATTKKLARSYIMTIGQLANASPEMLQAKLGIAGLMLNRFAKGEDRSPVMPYVDDFPVVSIGNSMTTRHDMPTIESAKGLITLLTESIVARMMDQGFQSRCVEVSVRTSELYSFQGQETIEAPTILEQDIVNVAMRIFLRKGFDKLLPLRWIGVRCKTLSPINAPRQINLFEDEEKRQQRIALQFALHNIKNRFGHQAVRLGISTMDDAYSDQNPKEDDRFHQPAQAYYRGG